MNYKLFAAACLVSTILYVDVFSQALTYPKTAKGTTVDDYHGTKVSDPYRWLEIDTAKEVMAWVEAENKVTNAYLSNIPFRDGFKKRLTEIVNYEKFLAPSKVGDYYFFSKNDGLQNQSVIYYQRGIDGVPMVFIDPNKMSKDGTAAISILGFSHDKKHVAYGINESGSDHSGFIVFLGIRSDGRKHECKFQQVFFHGVLFRPNIKRYSWRGPIWHFLLQTAGSQYPRCQKQFLYF